MGPGLLERVRTASQGDRASSRHAQGGAIEECDVGGCRRPAAMGLVSLARGGSPAPLSVRCQECWIERPVRSLEGTSLAWMTLDGRAQRPQGRAEVDRQGEPETQDGRTAASATTTTGDAHGAPSSVLLSAESAAPELLTRDGALADRTTGASLPASYDGGGCAGPACRGESRHAPACLVCVHGLSDEEGLTLGLCTCARRLVMTGARP